MFAVDGMELKFEEEAFRAIAHEAVSNKTGARGLRRVLDEVLNEIIFEYGGSCGNVSEVKITKEMVDSVIEHDKMKIA